MRHLPTPLQLLRRPRDDTRARRFGIGSAVRGISRDRRAVVVVDVDGGAVHGTIDAPTASSIPWTRLVGPSTCAASGSSPSPPWR